MPAAHRLADIDTGHGCFPPRMTTAGSSDVFINGKPAHRVGDPYAVHGCGTCSPHGGVGSAGSGSVFTNGRAQRRVGDAVSCGGVAAVGSGDVFIGG
jgi:uncharacterized Zn-binding protein involved in type VI secretion